MDKAQQDQTLEMVRRFGGLYGWINYINDKMIEIAQNDPELSEAEQSLLREFAEGLNTILNATRVLEQTGHVLHRVGMGQMN